MESFWRLSWSDDFNFTIMIDLVDSFGDFSVQFRNQFFGFLHYFLCDKVALSYLIHLVWGFKEPLRFIFVLRKDEKLLKWIDKGVRLMYWGCFCWVFRRKSLVFVWMRNLKVLFEGLGLNVFSFYILFVSLVDTIKLLQLQSEMLNIWEMLFL